MTKFWADSKAMMDENPDLFKFPRAFLVLVDEQKIDMKTRTTSHKLTCHT